MDFVFDDSKSLKNKEKHNIDFYEAQKIWDDPFRVEISAKYVDEQRKLIIGRIDDLLWSAIITFRNTKIRIVSV